MTYWNREHEANLRILRDLVRELDIARDDTIPNMMRDLSDDDHDRTQDSRSRLHEARSHLARAIGSLGEASDQLPEPCFPGPIAFPTAADVMEREG